MVNLVIWGTPLHTLMATVQWNVLKGVSIPVMWGNGSKVADKAVGLQCIKMATFIPVNTKMIEDMASGI